MTRPSRRSSGELMKVVPIISDVLPHPVAAGKVSLDAIKLVDASRFGELPTPLPRQQDLARDLFGVPTTADALVAVSHGWRNQAHPDPCGYKQALLTDTLAALRSDLNVSLGAASSIFLFFDFLSVPQRPFRLEQAARTPEEMQQFRAALACMHHMYFVSDHIVHLPWDGRGLPGEGCQYTVPAGSLAEATFTQAGDRVQVLQPGNDPRIHMFDLVEQVDGQLITSVKQLDELLAKDRAAAMPVTVAATVTVTVSVTVKLRRYPFGLANNIDADLRGWVFLERFITMVKCAMLDEDSAEQVVITPSKAIRQQIMVGARHLRAAARRGRPSLKQELGRFNSELQQKHFSPASLDKTEMQTQKSCPKDRDHVCQIMQEFVDHLAREWEEEVVRQRSLSRKFMAFLTEWDSFSRPYAAKLEQASGRGPWPEALMLLLPLATPCMVTSVPLDAPYPPWWSHLDYYLLTVPACVSPCTTAVSLLIMRTSGVRFDWRRFLQLVVRCQALCPVICLVLVCLCVVWGVFPLPQGPIIGVVGAVPFVLLNIWFLCPEEQRASPSFRRRLAAGIVGFLSLCAIVITPMTLLTSAMGQVRVGWQLLISAGFFIDKLAFESVAAKLSRLLGADAMVLFLFNGLTYYQFSVCLGISKSTSWLVVSEQFALDLAENIYYLWSLERSGGSKNAGQQQYIMASLALREMLEVLGVVWFLCAFQLSLHVNPELSAQACPRGPGEVQRVQSFLCAYLAMEALGSLVTSLWLLKKGHNPLRLLHALVAAEWVAFSAFVAGNFGFYLFQNHSHSGLDPTFTFAWARSESASWVCGITWE